MRRKLIAGNWKMNLTQAGCRELASQLVKSLAGTTDVDVVLCPPAVYLETVGEQLKTSSLALGAQNICSHQAGAYTGEISAEMLSDVGCKYVIIGHSERRALFGETDAMVLQKSRAAFRADLIPIVCVGETLEQREKGDTRAVIAQQFSAGLAELAENEMSKTVIAYEPVWAIGTGRVATAEQAEEVHADLRNLLKSRYNQDVSDRVQILYGGSVKPENAAELLAQPNIDGSLVGGASLKADSYSAIVFAAT